ncbi:ATP-binding cassette domain-containing protein [Candidatus Bipolaricaulota bacterium]|jgi:NitT/TauT family transport system ATP-binding protein|nr:ATP-binding cassette domain-containing protein [Candidatus Bipolaricaulota bacterium]
MIDVDAVTIDYGQGEQTVRAVEDVSFRLDKGKSLALIGPSGCGKTSLLFALSGLLQPRSGKITLDGEEVTNPRRDVALILQNAGLLPWKTVWQNANLSLLLNGDFPQQNAAEVLAHLGLDNVMKRFPAELSEGMKRRVGIARALSTSPSVLLMDEPLASLDTLTREKIQDLFLNLWHEHGFSMILVTHNIEEAAFLGQRIIVFTDRPARISAIVENPQMGSLDYREDPVFQGVMSQLREALEA